MMLWFPNVSLSKYVCNNKMLLYIKNIEIEEIANGCYDIEHYWIDAYRN